MITPSSDEIVKLAEKYTTIPVCREIYADMITPIALLRRLQTRSDRFFLLESVEGGEKWARYSFLGYDPILRATCKNGTVTLEGAENRTVETDKPLSVLREVLSRYRAPHIEGLPPFTGGFVGYFAYAMLGYAEPTLRIKRGAWDDFDLMLFDKVIAYDHLKQKIVLIVNMQTDNVLENYGKACASLEAMAALIGDQTPLPPLRVTAKPQFTCNVTEEQYTDIVEKTREYIFNGDIFQAVQPPFTGGFVGYFAYAMLGYAEPTLRIKRGAWDDFDLMLFDKVIAYDHLKQKIVLIVNMQTDNVLENYGKACASLEAMAALIGDQTPLPPLRVTAKPQFTCNVTEEQYTDIVEKTREYIFNGDIFQAVQSRQFTSPYADSLLSAYRVLRTTNPSPYMVFLSVDGDEIMCSSPETLVRLQDGRLTTFPVAGSRPRGKTEEEDKALERELLADEKELSEHNMLVDLGRNDLGRVSRVGTVEVTDYMMIHRYSRIMHICSQVEGDIAEQYDACDAIEAVLPAGTLSGAPKIRACEIIEEQESEPRGVYGGALGYLDFAGNMDTCIAIRMAAKKNGIVTVQAGGGIVADSVPHNEYMESANKARAVINALESASEVDG